MSKEQATKKPQSKAKKILSAILTVILVLLVIGGIALVVHVKTAKDPSIFGYSVYTVATGSMTPALRVGDVILVKKVTDPKELQKDDIITFYGQGKQSGKIITHRIISEGVESDGTIHTCGDANYGLADDPIGFEHVIGKMVKKSGALYFLHSAFSSKIGFVLIVFLPLLVLLIIQVVNFARACKMDKDGKVKGEEVPEESEEEKDRKLIEEYLRRQKETEQKENEGKEEEKKEE